MAQIKHTVKCRKCGHVYDVKVCDLSSVPKVVKEIVITTGVWELTGRKCPQCGISVSSNPPTTETDVEEL